MKKTLLILSIYSLSFPSYADCTKIYSQYLPKLKNIVHLYRKRNFTKIHFKYKNDFIRDHHKITLLCKNTVNKDVLADIRYGKTFVTSLTIGYAKILKKYGFINLILDEKNKISERESGYRSNSLPFSEKNRSFKHKKEARLFKEQIRKSNKDTKKIIPINDPLIAISDSSIESLFLEEMRLITSEKNTLKRFKVSPSNSKIVVIEKKDYLEEAEEDVLLIEVK